MLLLVDVAACVFIADFLSGFFHWLEDAYGQEEWPITGKLITKPNILHHHEPAYFTRHGWFKSADLLLVMGALVLLAAWLMNRLTWEVVLAVAIGANANEVHKWTHRTRRENGRLICSFQDIGVLQSRSHHARHHRGQKNTHYCVITNYLNPVLEAMGLWQFLERLIYVVFRVRRRPDPSVAPVGHEATSREVQEILEGERL